MEIEDSKTTDSSQANLIYQENLDKLLGVGGNDRIMKFIKHHYEYQRPRIKKLDAYYQGRNVTILEKEHRREDTEKADYRATHSFARYIADFQTSYSVGNPVTIKTEEDKNERFDAISDANNFDELNYNLFLDVTKYGRAYEFIYRNREDVEKSVRLDPLDTFVIYDTSVDPQPIMAVRYHQIELADDDNIVTINFVPEYWTADAHVTFEPTNVGGTMTQTKSADSNPAIENIKTFPVIEYNNNVLRLGDYDNVLSLIDLYDAAQSDTANYMTDLNDAMLLIKGDIDTLLDGTMLLSGVDPQDKDAMKKLAQDKLDILKEMKHANILLLKSGISPTGQQTTSDAGYIHKEYDVNGTEAYKLRISQDIHKFSHTPDLTDANFASNVSGVAMKFKLLGTVELAAVKRRMFEKGLYKRYEIISDLEQAAHSDLKIDTTQLTFTFKDNLPTDDVAQIQAIVQAGATLPQEYLYQYVPGITSPDDLKDMMDKQAQEQERKDNDYHIQVVGGDADDTTGTNQEVHTPSGEEGQEQSGTSSDNQSKSK